MKQVLVKLNEDEHRQVKIACATHGMTMRAFFILAMRLAQEHLKENESSINIAESKMWAGQFDND